MTRSRRLRSWRVPSVCYLVRYHNRCSLLFYCGEASEVSGSDPRAKSLLSVLTKSSYAPGALSRFVTRFLCRIAQPARRPRPTNLPSALSRLARAAPQGRSQDRKRLPKSTRTAEFDHLIRLMVDFGLQTG
jgi:hypothetical protein